MFPSISNSVFRNTPPNSGICNLFAICLPFVCKYCHFLSFVCHLLVICFLFVCGSLVVSLSFVCHLFTIRFPIILPFPGALFYPNPIPGYLRAKSEARGLPICPCPFFSFGPRIWVIDLLVGGRGGQKHTPPIRGVAQIKAPFKCKKKFSLFLSATAFGNKKYKSQAPGVLFGIGNGSARRI